MGTPPRKTSHNHHHAPEIARLREKAAECRLKAIECQLALGFTLCEIAETEIRYQRPDEAMNVVNRLLHHAETLSFHVNEPNHVPRAAISSLREQLLRLKARTEEIDSHLRR